MYFKTSSASLSSILSPRNTLSCKYTARGRQLFAESPVSSPPVPVQNVFSSTPSTELGQGLTQKEYLIAIRNRLFSVEEQIWLHDFSVARPGLSKMSPLPEGKYNALLRARGELLDEYPVTKLYTDLLEAQQKNMSYAAMYLERLISTFNRQLPTSMLHINQIAVISDRGRIVNLMRGQGNVYHRLVPSSVTTEKDVTRQFQHPAFSSNGKYVAFSEMHFKDKGKREINKIIRNKIFPIRKVVLSPSFFALILLISSSFPFFSLSFLLVLPYPFFLFFSFFTFFLLAIVRADALVFEVPTDPKEYGATDSLPIFDSGELPGESL